MPLLPIIPKPGCLVITIIGIHAICSIACKCPRSFFHICLCIVINTYGKEFQQFPGEIFIGVVDGTGIGVQPDHHGRAKGDAPQQFPEVT